MRKVIILDSDTMHMNKLKMMLQMEKEEYDIFYLDNPETAIHKIESEQIDVFICCLENLTIPANQIVEIASLMSADTVIIMMSECKDVRFVLNSMNQYNPFRLIIKPCECAEDITAPINDAFVFLEEKQDTMSVADISQESLNILSENLAEIETALSRNKHFYQSVEQCVMGMLKGNMEFLDTTKNKQHYELILGFLKIIYQKYLLIYVFGEQDFQTMCNTFIKEYNCPEKKCGYRILFGKGVSVSAETAQIVAFVIDILSMYCKELLIEYDVQITITRKDDYLVIRQSADLEHSKNSSGEIMYRTLDTEIITDLQQIITDFFDFISVKNVIGEMDNPFTAKVLIKES